MTPAATRSGPLAAALAIVALALAGCAPTGSTATQAAGTSPPASADQVVFQAELTSDYSKTYPVGASDSKVFGVNILAGNTKINGEKVRVEVLGTVDYEAGSGPFGSFLALQWPDGSVLGVQLEGQATQDSATEATGFDAELTVIDGSGKAEGITGSGSFAGSRAGPLATAIDIEVALDL
ncbi:MAG: hypothetical protein K0U64_07670, partial [Actinomycetia bacterium]|nr:hypothetical protein [Actinomycetes bacterium]